MQDTAQGHPEKTTDKLTVPITNNKDVLGTVPTRKTRVLRSWYYQPGQKLDFDYDMFVIEQLAEASVSVQYARRLAVKTYKSSIFARSTNIRSWL
jgi:hypothetical protein